MNYLLIVWVIANILLVLTTLIIWGACLFSGVKLTTMFNNGRFWLWNLASVGMTYLSFRPDVHAAVLGVLN